MKVIIVEGPDNCGKNTLINKISENFLTITQIHYTKPENPQIQNTMFRGYAYAIANKVYKTDAVILNRSHYGEYVYGCMYRGVPENEVMDIIHEVEDIFLKNNLNVYYIQLMSTDAELLLKNDDNKSLSMQHIEYIKEEYLRFMEIFNKSRMFKKKCIFVNDGKKFRNPDDIYEDAMRFINDIDGHEEIKCCDE